MRDQYTTLANNFTLQASAGILKIKEILSTNKDKESRENLKQLLLNAQLRITIAEYTKGGKKTDVSYKLTESITTFKDSFIWSGFENGYGQYDQMLWIVSLAILCDVPAEDFKKITDVLKRDGANDKLLSFLIKSKLMDWDASNAPVIQQSPYAIAGQITGLTDETAGIAAIKNYLQSDWYKGNSDAPWYDSHKNKKLNTYFGYWAWEAAAIVKIKGWNDEKLKDLKYYPYDAVHW